LEGQRKEKTETKDADMKNSRWGNSGTMRKQDNVMLSKGR
jgi:hypothetical protein